MHHFPKKSRKVDALLHLFPIDSPRTLQLLFSFSGFSLPAIFLLQLLFQFLRFFSARKSAATNAKRSDRHLRHLPPHSRPFLRPQKRSDQREAQRPAPQHETFPPQNSSGRHPASRRNGLPPQHGAFPHKTTAGGTQPPAATASRRNNSLRDHLHRTPAFAPLQGAHCVILIFFATPNVV